LSTFSRLSLSSTLIRASIVGCQFNFANKRRHGGKEERNSDLLINLELEESEEIDMAVRGEKGDQSNQQACRQRRPSGWIQRGRALFRIISAGSEIDGINLAKPGGGRQPSIVRVFLSGMVRVFSGLAARLQQPFTGALAISDQRQLVEVFRYSFNDVVNHPSAGRISSINSARASFNWSRLRGVPARRNRH
jgi:hypothetical protein